MEIEFNYTQTNLKRLYPVKLGYYKCNLIDSIFTIEYNRKTLKTYIQTTFVSKNMFIPFVYYQNLTTYVYFFIFPLLSMEMDMCSTHDLYIYHKYQNCPYS